MQNDLLLELKNVSYKVYDEEILENISFSVEKSSILKIIGPNGAGKSTLAKIIAGILKPTLGQIKKYQNIKLGYVPQKFHLRKTIPATVSELLRSCISPARSLEEIIEIIDLKSLFDKSILDLSGGELKKVLIARALMNTKDLIILDEASSCLDLTAKHEFYILIKKIKSTLNCAIIIISHDLFFAFNDENNIICINKKIYYIGKSKDIRHSVDDAFMNKLSRYNIYSDLLNKQKNEN